MKQACSGRSAHRPLRIAAASGLLAGCVAFGGSANVALMFTFDYTGNTAGVGFLDAAEGAARQTALDTAGTLFSNLFGSYFTDMATINMAVTSTNDINVATLASALSNVENSPGFGTGEVIRTKLQTGVDLNGAALDGVVDVNWAYDWQLDPDADPGATGWDLYATLYHEFTHALGFGSEIFGNPVPADRFGQGEPGSGSPGSWSKWDEFLTSCQTGNSLINGTTLEADAAATSDARANGGCFVGSNAVAANGGVPVQLFADGDQSHLDEATYSSSMMRPFRNEGYETRDYNAVELGVLTDLGYTRKANVVPAPAPIALLLLGLAGLGLRRRKS